MFLTCFNRNLATYMASQISGEVVCESFLDYLLGQLAKTGRGLQVPEGGAELSRFYDDVLPTAAFDYFAEAPMEEKFDAIIVDEGQDFSENWYTCLKAMLRDEDEGEFYVLPIPTRTFSAQYRSPPLDGSVAAQADHNLRNTEHISKWIGSFVKKAVFARAPEAPGCACGLGFRTRGKAAN